MIELGQHMPYIVGAWAGVALVTTGLIIATLRAAARQSRRLASLEARGIKRRSTRGSAG